jgi:hypothetical protein
LGGGYTDQRSELRRPATAPSIDAETIAVLRWLAKA